ERTFSTSRHSCAMHWLTQQPFTFTRISTIYGGSTMPVTHEPVLLKPRIEDFLTYCGARNLASHTIRAYRADLKGFMELAGELTTADLNRKLVRGFLTQLHDRGISEQSIQRKLRVVKIFCSWLE